MLDTILEEDHPRIISAKLRWPPLLKIEISSNGQNCSILSPNLNCISIMMSFLTNITGFFMNFELLPILTDYAN
jgi:hypothetical protein